MNTEEQIRKLQENAKLNKHKIDEMSLELTKYKDIAEEEGR